MSSDAIPRLYHRGMMRGLRVAHLLEEIGEPYEVQYLKTTKEQQVAEQMRDAGIANGHNFMPMLVHGELTIFESAAILSYLTDLSQKFGGNNAQERALVLQWCCFCETLMGTPNRNEPKGQKKMAEKLQTIEQIFLANPNQEYLLASGFSAADCAMCHTIDFVSRLFGVDMSPHPQVQEYYKRVQARPAYKRAAGEWNNDERAPGLFGRTKAGAVSRL